MKTSKTDKKAHTMELKYANKSSFQIWINNTNTGVNRQTDYLLLTQTWKCCHLFLLVSFQTFMIFFLLWNIK